MSKKIDMSKKGVYLYYIITDMDLRRSQMNMELELSHKDGLGLIDRKLFNKVTSRKQKKEIARKIAAFTDSAVPCEEWPNLIENHADQYAIYTHEINGRTYAKLVHYFICGIKRDMHNWKAIK